MPTTGYEATDCGPVTLAGYVNVIPSAVSVQAMAAAGADWITIDQSMDLSDRKHCIHDRGHHRHSLCATGAGATAR